MAELKIEYLSKDELKPYAGNAKIHTAEQIEQIKASIREFGFNDPIAIWHDNEIIEGHGRLLAVMEMEDFDEVPVIRLDNLSDEERRAYMLAHNKLTMNTGFDFATLADELDRIKLLDMEKFGFEDIHLDSFFSDDEEDESSGEKEPSYRIIANCGNEENKTLLIAFLNDNGIEYQEL